MNNIQLQLNEKEHGSFFIREGEEKIAEMVIGISDEYLTVYHTEVSQQATGRGLAKQLLTAMVEYARQHTLKVIPLCPYVHAQFKKHPEHYLDLWKNENSILK
jgi:hypothetical protein